MIRNSAVYTVGSMLPQAVSLFLLPIFTRYLSTRDYGILGYSLTTATFFSALGALAIQPFIIRYYFEAKAVGDVKRFFGTIFAFLLVYNLLLLAAASLLLPPLFLRLRIQVPFAPYVQLALFSAVMQILGLIPMSYFRATERAGVFVGLALLASLLSGGLSLYLIVGRGMGLVGRFYGQLGADAAMLVVYLAIMSRISRIAWRGVYVRQALGFCLPLVPAHFLAMFFSMSDRFVLERWVPLSQLGLYSVAAGFAATAPLLTSGVYSAIQPQIFRLASTAELDRRMPTVKRYIVWLLMGLMCAGIALSRDLVAVLAAPAFRDTYKVATLLVVGILVQSFISNVPSQYLTAVGKTKYEMPSRLGGGVIGLAAMLALVPWFGVYGAGLASIITALATLFIYHLFLRSESLIEWHFSRDVVLMGSAAVVGYALLQIHTPFVAVSAAIKLGLIALVATVYLARSSTSLRHVLPRLGLAWLAGRS